MQPPTVVASLPTPLDKRDGKIQAAPVFGLTESRKRKRHEIVVALDGEGLHIYNIPNQTLISSYPLPSQTYHCCAPFSVLKKTKDAKTACRHTYAIVRESKSASQCKIICVSHSPISDKLGTTQLQGPTTKEKMLQRVDVHGIEVMPSGSEQHDVFIYYRNGDVEILSSDLDQEFVCSTISNTQCYEVLFSTVVGFESARKGLLKHRSDLIRTGHALCQVVKLQYTHQFRLYSIQELPALPEKPLKFSTSLILQHDLPGHADISESRPMFELHTSSGVLYELLKGDINVYDIAGVLPRTICTLSSPWDTILGFSRLSAQSLLAVSSKQATVYETTFGTAKSVTQIVVDDVGSNDGKKRKRSDSSDGLLNSIITIFPRADIAVLLSASQLLTLQTAPLNHLKVSTKSTSTLLVDVLGNGDHSPRVREHSDRDIQWGQWVQELEKHVSKGHVRSLECFVARSLGISLGKDEQGRIDPDLWDIRSAISSQGHRRKAISILGSIFEHSHQADETSQSQGLRLSLPTENILIWLAVAGFLNAKHLREALSAVKSESIVISSGDIFSAINKSTNGLEMIYSILSCPAQLDTTEVVQAMKLIIRSLDGQNTGPLQSKDEEYRVNIKEAEQVAPNSGDDLTLEVASRNAELELQRALHALSSGLEIRSEILRLAFTRLLSFPPALISQTMRNLLAQNDIIFLIHILRLELANGGWTTRYIDSGAEGFENQMPLVGSSRNDEDVVGPLDQAIEAISMLLNCAMDAIGISGWLVGQSGRHGTEDMLDSLRAEVSAVLEGCYEASSLDNLLQDLEKYEYQKGKSDQAIRSAGKKRKWRTDDILSPSNVESNPALPLGCKSDVPQFYGKGSGKAFAMLEKAKNRMAGQYEIDRIRI